MVAGVGMVLGVVRVQVAYPIVAGRQLPCWWIAPHGEDGLAEGVSVGAVLSVTDVAHSVY